MTTTPAGERNVLDHMADQVQQTLRDGSAETLPESRREEMQAAEAQLRALSASYGGTINNLATIVSTVSRWYRRAALALFVVLLIVFVLVFVLGGPGASAP